MIFCIYSAFLPAAALFSDFFSDLFSFIQELDWNILYAIQQTLKSRSLDRAMPFVTFLGNSGMIWIAAALFFLTAGLYVKKRETLRERNTNTSLNQPCVSGDFLIRIGLTIGAGLLLELIVGNVLLKNLIARARPCWLDTDMVMLIPVPSDFSFPSGHTFSSFTAAFILFFFKKSWGTPALAIAVLISFSRLYLFVHFPSDVAAGAILGFLLALAVFRGSQSYFRQLP